MMMHLFTVARQLYQAGQVIEAKAKLREILQSSPAFSPAADMLWAIIYNEAVADFNARRYADSEHRLHEADAVQPGHPETKAAMISVMRYQAAEHISAGRKLQAGIIIGEVIRRQPSLRGQYGSTLATLAQALHEHALKTFAEQPYEACSAAASAWRLDPDNSVIYENLWKMLVSIGTSFLSKPLEAAFFREKLTLNNDDYVALVGLGNVLRRIDKGWEAETFYRRAIAVWPDAPFAASRLACLLAAQRRFPEADRLFTDIAKRFDGREAIIRLDKGFMADLIRRSDEILPPALCFPDGLPVPAHWPLVVMIGCDGLYFEKFRIALINSIINTSGVSCAIHFHVVDPPAEIGRIIKEMRHDFSHDAIFYTYEQSDPALTADARRAYYSCARFLQLPHLVTAYGCPVLLLDADMVVLNPLAEMLLKLQRSMADIGIVAGENFEIWGLLWAGLIYISGSARAVAFLERVALYIAYFQKEGRLN